MGKAIAVHPYNGLNIKKDWAIETYENVDDFQRMNEKTTKD